MRPIALPDACHGPVACQPAEPPTPLTPHPTPRLTRKDEDVLAARQPHTVRRARQRKPQQQRVAVKRAHALEGQVVPHPRVGKRDRRDRERGVVRGECGGSRGVGRRGGAAREDLADLGQHRRGGGRLVRRRRGRRHGRRRGLGRGLRRGRGGGRGCCSGGGGLLLGARERANPELLQQRLGVGAVDAVELVAAVDAWGGRGGAGAWGWAAPGGGCRRWPAAARSGGGGRLPPAAYPLPRLPAPVSAPSRPAAPAHPR
jgi:hypothetical protein